MIDPRPVTPLGGPIPDVTVTLPGSKSITNRALVCAALADGPSVLSNVLDSDDTNAMERSLRSLGVEITRDGDRTTVWGCRGRLPVTTATLDAAMSGTTSRFLLAVATLGEGPITIDAAPSMRSRPMADGIAAVEQLGRRVDSTDGGLPLTVSPDPDVDEMSGGVSVRGDVSSQFLTGLLLVGPCRRDGLEISVDGPLQSVPYVDMTIGVMRAFGAKVETDEDRSWFAIAPTGYQHRSFDIEPDASAASYFLAAAALCGGTVTVEGLGMDSLQGDLRFADVLAAYGAEVDITAEAVTVTGARLIGGEIDMSDISDTAQTLAAIAPFAEGPTTVGGIGFIRRKETDRIAAVVAELTRLGVTAEELDDGFRIEPGAVSPGVVSTYNDHRMAMSFAVLGLRAPGISIADPGCVSKTFPGFWATLDRLKGAV
jgi:3-phosphoshikimate 1-carboxyvinyltransferase